MMITISLEYKIGHANYKSEIQLIDLAGTERTGQSSKINSSLSVLSRIVKDIVNNKTQGLS